MKIDVETAECIIKDVREAVDKDLYIGKKKKKNYIKAYDFLNNGVDEAAKHANETYDKFLITCLEPYGFTKENVSEEASRIVIYEKNMTCLEILIDMYMWTVHMHSL